MSDQDHEQLQPPQRQSQPGIEQEMTPEPDAARPQHQHHLGHRLPRQSEPARLLLDQGRHRGLHPEPVPAAGRPWHPSERGRSRADLDTADPGHHAGGEGGLLRQGRAPGPACQPEEVAPCYLFLASEDASYMAGQVLHPNGGNVVNG